MKFNTKYKYDKVSGFHFTKPSLTDQSQAYDSDINNIVKSSGIVASQSVPGQYGLTFDANTLQDSLNIVAKAKNEFSNLPANVRREFDNDMQKFVEFYDSCAFDEVNARKGVKLGIFKPEILDSFKPADITLIQPTVQSKTQTASGSADVSA